MSRPPWHHLQAREDPTPRRQHPPVNDPTVAGVAGTSGHQLERKPLVPKDTGHTVTDTPHNQARGAFHAPQIPPTEPLKPAPSIQSCPIPDSQRLRGHDPSASSERRGGAQDDHNSAESPTPSPCSELLPHQVGVFAGHGGAGPDLVHEEAEVLLQEPHLARRPFPAVGPGPCVFQQQGGRREPRTTPRDRPGGS